LKVHQIVRLLRPWKTSVELGSATGLTDEPLPPFRALALGIGPDSFSPVKLADFPKLKQLSARQKLKLAEELWFDGVSDEALPVPAWHQELLAECVAAYKAGNLKAISVGELKRRLKVR
jgi:hypothetical protein